MRTLSIIAGAFCVLSFLSGCQKPGDEGKEEETVKLPPAWTKDLPFTETLALTDFFPELTDSPSIVEDERMGYCLSLGKQEWTMPYSVDPAYIPAQDFSFSVHVDPPGSSSRRTMNTVQYVVLEDVSLPGTGCDHMELANCESLFKLTITLDSQAPYSKVSLSRLEIDFPDWFRASCVDVDEDGEIPTVTVTPDGVDLVFRLESVYDPIQFFDKDGRRCYSVETTVSAVVNAVSEDAVVPDAATTPLDLHFSFGFERIDFHGYMLVYKDLTFPAETVDVGDVRLPSFLTAEGTDVALPEPYILFECRNTIPFSPIRLKAAVVHGDNRAGFTMPDHGKFMLMSEMDGVYREGVTNMDVSSLGKLFRLPVKDGILRPSYTFQPIVEGVGIFDPDQSYEMSVRTEGLLPLSFTGNLAVEGIATAPLQIEGDPEIAPARSKHKIRQTLGSTLPFDCRVTPVFTMEGEPPVYLDDIVVQAWDYGRTFSYSFTPATDSWKASLYYIVTPSKGRKIFFNKEYNFTVKDSEVTFNKND